MYSVFISYCQEDFTFALALYDFLACTNYRPWLDKKNILPGGNWDVEIKTALRSADFIVILLSETSVQKRGYIQREFKIALEYCEEKLDGDIYIIPLKLDQCAIPSPLSKFQWINYHQKDALNQVIKSIETQIRKYNKTIPLAANKEPTGLEYSFDHSLKNRGYRRENKIYSQQLFGPSLFNRLHLVSQSFQFVNETQNLNGNTVYHQIVSETFDIAEVFFYYSSMRSYTSIEIIPWNPGILNISAKDVIVAPQSDLDKLLHSQNDNLRLLGKTFVFFLLRERHTINANILKQIFILKVDGVIIGGTSPITIFVPAEFDHKKLHLEDLQGNKLFGGLARPLHMRNDEFITYIYSMRKYIPAFESLYSSIDDYLEISLDKIDSRNPLVKKAESVYMKDYDNIFTNKDPMLAVEVNGYNINCRSAKSIQPK